MMYPRWICDSATSPISNQSEIRESQQDKRIATEGRMDKYGGCAVVGARGDRRDEEGRRDD